MTLTGKMLFNEHRHRVLRKILKGTNVLIIFDKEEVTHTILQSHRNTSVNK